MLFYPLKIRARRVVPSKSTGTVLGVGLVALNTSDWLITHSIFLFEPPFLKKNLQPQESYFVMNVFVVVEFCSGFG